jgi:hypothetical protein
MADKRNSSDEATGVGPGVTGASGDLIEGTGGDAGIGGTGEQEDEAASGQRPDERQAPGPQQLGHEPRERAGVTRPSGSRSGTSGGGGPRAVPTDEGDPGRSGGGALNDVPGGVRNVGPPNDEDTSGDRAHRQSEK